MADTALIEQRAARLKEQAAALHRADTEAIAEVYLEVGQRKDAATRQLSAARQGASEAASQAQTQHDKAKEFETQAQALELQAKDPLAPLIREDEALLEQAQKLRGLSAAASERATENHRAVTAHTEEAQRLEQEIKALQTQIDIESSPTEKLADVIDDMVDRLSHAVENLHEADRLASAGNQAAAEAMRGQAERELERLETITPDYRSVDQAVLQKAGITRADTDLIDPTVLPDAPHTAPPAAAAAPSGADVPAVDGGTAAEPGGLGAASPPIRPAEKTAMREPADLAAELAALRDRATRLHEEAGKRWERHLGESGGARDEAAAEAWALRQKAKAADIQAQREHREAVDFEKQASASDAEAATLEKAGQPAEAQEARENADALRAMARSHTKRASDAEHRAQEALDQAEPLDKQVRDHDAEKGIDLQPQQMERVADQLDDKVRLLDEAVAARDEALRLRDAGEQAQAVAAAERAVQAQAKADAIDPAYDKLDDAAKAAAGLDDPEIEMDVESSGPDGPAGDAPSAGPAPAEEDAEPQIDPQLLVELAKDTDQDGITDQLELRMGTDPLRQDTDGDGLTDGFEERWRHTGIDPLVTDGDKDGSDDGEELARGSDPLNPNTDGDQRLDGDDLLPTDATETLGGPSTPAVPPDVTTAPAADPYDTQRDFAPEEPANSPEGAADDSSFEFDS